MAKVFPHSRNAKHRYTFNARPWLESIGATITSYVFTAETGLVTSSPTSNSYEVTTLVEIASSASRGRALSLTCKVTASNGEIDERTAEIQVATL